MINSNKCHCLLFFFIGLFGFAFYTGVRSYQKPCIKKILELENSKLKENILKTLGQR